MTIPYAVKEGGLLSLSLLLLFALICCYTGILLKRCLESYPGITSYPDIGQAAFGIVGRLGIAVSTIRFTSMVLNCSCNNSCGRFMIFINFLKNCSQMQPQKGRIAVLAT
jgi:vesicular inhibitory amino acid transporter